MREWSGNVPIIAEFLFSQNRAIEQQFIATELHLR